MKRVFCFATVLLSCGLVPQVVAARDQIGIAATVRNNVSQVEPQVSKIQPGDDIIRDEVVRTLIDSGAKFVLKDSTNLILGPNSSLKLDRAVFSDEKSVGDIAIKLTEGSFRFITGNSSKESYAINTPLATMGVRGTVLDILVEKTKNTVVLKEGGAQVCAGPNCIDLKQYGDTAIITANGGHIDIGLSTSNSWSFDSACSGMCGQTTFAQASLSTGSIGGGGGGGGGGQTGTGPTGGQNLGSTTPEGQSVVKNGSQNL